MILASKKNPKKYTHDQIATLFKAVLDGQCYEEAGLLMGADYNKARSLVLAMAPKLFKAARLLDASLKSDFDFSPVKLRRDKQMWLTWVELHLAGLPTA
jgi:hypothetical protein